jgi:hypothetical protein
MIDRVITNIYKGILRIVKIVLSIAILYLISYLLTYISDLNTRTIFIRLLFLILGLKVLYTLGQSDENHKK